MDLLSSSRPGWWPRVTPKLMVWIILRHFLPLPSWTLFMCLFPSLLIIIGHCISLIFIMFFSVMGGVSIVFLYGDLHKKSHAYIKNSTEMGRDLNLLVCLDWVKTKTRVETGSRPVLNWFSTCFNYSRPFEQVLNSFSLLSMNLDRNLNRDSFLHLFSYLFILLSTVSSPNFF